MVKLMIADDNMNFSSCCRNFLTKDSNIKIITSTIDGNATLEAYLKFKPDILLLDLDLPRLNGIDIINSLTNFPEEKKLCNIIVITGSADLQTKLLNTSKIYKILLKPCNFEELLRCIKEISILNEHNTIDIEKLNSLLLKLSFNLYTKGTRYLIDAILIAYDNPNLLYNISDLYSLVGLKYNISGNLIKWSINNSLSTMNRYVDKNILYSIFSEYDGRNITPKYFISILLNYFKTIL